MIVCLKIRTVFFGILFATCVYNLSAQEAPNTVNTERIARFILDWSKENEPTKRPDVARLTAEEQYQVAIALRYYLAHKEEYEGKLKFESVLGILQSLSTDAAYEGILYVALYGKADDANATLYVIMLDSGWSCMAAYLKILDRTDIEESLIKRLKLKLDTYLSMMPSSIYEQFDDAFLKLDSSTEKTILYKEFSRVYNASLDASLPYTQNFCNQQSIMDRILRIRESRRGVGRNLYPQKDGPQEPWAKQIMDAVAK